MNGELPNSQACRALAHLHASGVVHRDIKYLASFKGTDAEIQRGFELDGVWAVLSCYRYIIGPTKIQV